MGASGLAAKGKNGEEARDYLYTGHEWVTRSLNSMALIYMLNPRPNLAPSHSLAPASILAH